MPYSLSVFTGNANPELAEEICEQLGVPLGGINVGHFSDGEIKVQIEDNVRGADIFIVQPTCTSVNHNLMELLIMVDAFRRASARRITAVVPYYGYARQDRKDRPRVPITSKLVANLLLASGVNRLLCMDLHAGQLQGYFDIPVDHLYALPVMIEYFSNFVSNGDTVVVSPDAGGVERARNFARKLGGVPLAIMDKRRPKANVAEVMNIIGEVEGMRCIIVDDMIDTAGTLTKVAEALMKNGATEVIACASHAVLSGPAIERIEASPLKEVVVTNSIPLGDKKACEKITQLSVAGLLSEAIRRIHNEESVSSLFLD